LDFGPCASAIPHSAFRIPHLVDSALRIPHSTLEKFRIPAGPDGPLGRRPHSAFRVPHLIHSAFYIPQSAFYIGEIPHSAFRIPHSSGTFVPSYSRRLQFDLSALGSPLSWPFRIPDSAFRIQVVPSYPRAFVRSSASRSGLCASALLAPPPLVSPSPCLPIAPAPLLLRPSAPPPLVPCLRVSLSPRLPVPPTPLA
jgi:hypothetical protein